jgi:uncharacterized protein (DUF1778 family)
LDHQNTFKIRELQKQAFLELLSQSMKTDEQHKEQLKKPEEKKQIPIS